MARKDGRTVGHRDRQGAGDGNVPPSSAGLAEVEPRRGGPEESDAFGRFLAGEPAHSRMVLMHGAAAAR
jgi:hypothetical protein